MYLKRLEMQGFKSFADKTVLDFEQGVTAVVGPNGSGKSNISDAIRWVLGEMSAKSLRGSNMQDVIFSGTQKRKPVNFAEVSLVLDNSDHTFPIEFDEVVVTRRVFRSGETAYQINKANCRLKDIHELFMDTGLGRDGYSIIGQGNVSQILSTKAEDRRSLFEEAAGIAKYKHRKEEAQRKLESVNENLIRINDVAAELENQIEPLRNQSEKARKYLVLYEEYKELDINMSLKLLEEGKRKLEEAKRQYDDVNDELSSVRGQEGDLEQKLKSLYEQSKQKDEEQSQKNNQLIENETKNMSIANAMSIAQNNIQNNENLIARIDKEIDDIQQLIRSYELQITQTEQEIAIKETEANTLTESFSEVNTHNDTLAAEIEQYHEKIENLKADAIELMNSISFDKAKMNGIDNLRKNFLERKEVVETEVQSHNQGLEQTKTEIDHAELTVGEKKEKLEKMRVRVHTQQKRMEEITNGLHDTDTQLVRLNTDYQAKASKKRMLEDMENGYEGYARSVKAVLTAPQLKKMLIYGTLSGLITVQDEYVTAIETALAGAMQNIVVESEDDAKQAIQFLRETRAGRATFLPVSAVQGRELERVKEISAVEGFIGIASSLVSYDKKYDGIVKNLLGRVVIMDTIDHAIAISKKFGYRFKVVTLAGDILNAGGSMSGGSSGKNSGFLSRANEIKALGGQINTLHTKIKRLAEEKAQLEKDRENVNVQLASYTPLMREYEDEILKLENTLQHLRQTLSASGSTEQSLQAELEQIEQQLIKSNDDVAMLINAIRQKETRSAEIQENIRGLETEYAKLVTAKEQKSQLIMDNTMKLRSIEKDISQAKENIIRHQALAVQGKEQIEEKRTDKQKLIAENETLVQQITENEKLSEQISAYSGKIKEQITEIDRQKAVIVENLQTIQNSNKELTDKLILLQQELTRVESKTVRLNMEQENIISRLWDEYELSCTAAQQWMKEIEPERATAKYLAQLKGKIKSLGSVNMESIEEYQKVKERFEFMREQRADLEKARTNLNKIIDSMEELMQENFSSQFNVINDSFGRVFTELFGGGKGKLYLSDPEHVLESGIEIDVQLPGKGLQNISLYSGGEKSFIAIALLFAILNVKPTPFCILDEIDAALDDVNVSRFATYLRNYLEQTQFVVITHRRGTMEAANLMYGVTMQEKGVSKLLSLHIDEINEEMVN